MDVSYFGAHGPVPLRVALLLMGICESPHPLLGVSSELLALVPQANPR